MHHHSRGATLFNPNCYVAFSITSEISRPTLHVHRYYCEAQGKGRARGGPRKVTQRSFIDGGYGG